MGRRFRFGKSTAIRPGALPRIDSLAGPWTGPGSSRVRLSKSDYYPTDNVGYDRLSYMECAVNEERKRVMRAGSREALVIGIECEAERTSPLCGADTLVRRF